MAEIILFHHALGLTKSVRSLADRIEQTGHTVHTPDLFEGRHFDTTDDGAAHARKIGFDVVIDRGVTAADEFPDATVFAGVSMGVLPAYKLAQTRQGAQACIAIGAALPGDSFAPNWHDGIGLQIHLKDADPWVLQEDLPAARELAKRSADVYEYPGDEHLFTEEGHPEYDHQATELVIARLTSFCRRA